MGFISLEEEFSVGTLDIIADYAFLSTFKLLWYAHTSGNNTDVEIDLDIFFECY